MKERIPPSIPPIVVVAGWCMAFALCTVIVALFMLLYLIVAGLML